MNTDITSYFCADCDQIFPITTTRYCCNCGQPLLLTTNQTPLIPEQIAQRTPTLWRYWEALPIADPTCIISLGEGMTPLVRDQLDSCHHWFKLDYVFPTGSYKDRGASVLLSKAYELGIDRVIEDSSGNAGAAIAAYSARANIDCIIYCPEKTSAGKLAQILSYGATLELIPGNRAQTTQAVLSATDSIFYASHNWNPFFLSGVQTMAFEIVEQLDWSAPDAVICPVGFGGIYLSLYLGFQKLYLQGLIKKLPRLLGVQSESCCPIFRSLANNQSEITPMPVEAETLAEGIIAEQPIRSRMIKDVVSKTEGAFTTVTEDEIRAGLDTLAKKGIFVEPTSAVVVSGLEHFSNRGIVQPNDLVISILTGSGLKSTETLKKLVGY